MRAKAGLTLFELLITFSIFAIILTLTLFFYGQSLKATRRHDQGSEVYRRAHKLFSDVEEFVHSGVLMLVQEDQIAVSPFRAEQALQKRLLNWAPAQVLAITEEGVMVNEGLESRKIQELKSWEKLSFTPQPFDDHELQRRYDYVALNYSATPPSPTREGRLYEFSRQILLVRY